MVDRTGGGGGGGGGGCTCGGWVHGPIKGGVLVNEPVELGPDLVGLFVGFLQLRVDAVGLGRVVAEAFDAPVDEVLDLVQPRRQPLLFADVSAVLLVKLAELCADAVADLDVGALLAVDAVERDLDLGGLVVDCLL